MAKSYLKGEILLSEKNKILKIDIHWNKKVLQIPNIQISKWSWCAKIIFDLCLYVFENNGLYTGYLD